MKNNPKEPSDETFIGHCIFAIKQDKRASTTFLKEKFNIGYRKAKEIMAELANLGIVGEPDKTGNRYKEPVAVAVVADYQERGMILKRNSLSAFIVETEADYKQFTEATGNIQHNAVIAANIARKIGIGIQAQCGHEQCELLFWKRNFEGKVPYSFETAKMFVSIARKMIKPAETLAEAVSYIQPVLIGGGWLELPQRTEAQEPNVTDKIQKFFLTLTLFRQPFKKIISATPMEKWSAGQLDQFMAEIEWILIERDRAAKLRRAKFKE